VSGQIAGYVKTYSGAGHRPSGIVPSVTAASAKGGTEASTEAMEPALSVGQIRLPDREVEEREKAFQNLKVTVCAVELEHTINQRLHGAFLQRLHPPGLYSGNPCKKNWLIWTRLVRRFAVPLGVSLPESSSLRIVYRKA
jgi:hypothetical protein